MYREGAREETGDRTCWHSVLVHGFRFLFECVWESAEHCAENGRIKNCFKIISGAAGWRCVDPLLR